MSQRHFRTEPFCYSEHVKPHKAVPCGYCGADLANVTGVKSLLDVRQEFDPVPGNYSVEHWTINLCCEECRQLNVFEQTFVDLVSDEEEGDLDFHRIAPSETLFEELPATVQRAYIDANRVSSHGTGVYAGAIRRLIEATCADLGSRQANLEKSIDALCGVSSAPEHLIEMAHAIRESGNQGMHEFDSVVPYQRTRRLQSFAESWLDFFCRNDRRIENLKAPGPTVQ